MTSQNNQRTNPALDWFQSLIEDAEDRLAGILPDPFPPESPMVSRKPVHLYRRHALRDEWGQCGTGWTWILRVHCHLDVAQPYMEMVFPTAAAAWKLLPLVQQPNNPWAQPHRAG